MHLASHFFTATFALAISTVHAGVIPRGDKPPTCKKTKVAVLGAGVSGIIAAQALSNASISDFLIVEHNDYIGGRVRNAEFGKSSKGTPYSVELGANWVQGIESESGNVNPIWTLAQKCDLKNTPSNFESLLTYDQDGPKDYTDTIAEFYEKMDIAFAEAGEIQIENLQDTSMRAGLSLAGWKPGSDMYMQLAEWFGWDLEMANPPEQSALVFGATNHNATFKHFSLENNLVIDQRGFNTFIQEEAKEFLEENDPRVLLNTTIKKIAYGPEGVIITSSDGECIEADFAICTFSVGVLQSDFVTFEPELPRWKREAIEQFEMGTYTKLFMQFNETWWPEDKELFLYADSKERGWFPMFQNLGAPGFVEGSNILFGTVTGARSYAVEHQTDEETLAQIMEVLRSMFPDIDIPEPTDFMYPRWTMEEWAYGSYSNWPVGVTLERHQNLRANVDRLWFAGEANSPEWFGYLQGAYFEGLKTGSHVAEIISTGAADGSRDLTRYEVLHGTTTADEYNEANGWSLPLGGS